MRTLETIKKSYTVVKYYELEDFIRHYWEKPIYLLGETTNTALVFYVTKYASDDYLEQRVFDYYKELKNSFDTVPCKVYKAYDIFLILRGLCTEGHLEEDNYVVEFDNDLIG